MTSTNLEEAAEHGTQPDSPPAPPAAPAPVRRRWRVWRWLAWGLVVGVAGGLALEGYRSTLPPSALQAGPRTVEIPAQQGVLQVADLLVETEVIRNRVAFVALALVRGTARTLKAGEYEIPRGASLLATLELLESGRVKPHLLVVPEGSTVRDLARRLQAEGLASSEDVLRVAGDPFFVQTLGIEAEGVEGYLYPDTYQVTKGLRVEEILGRMAHRFREKVATPETLAKARARGLTLHQVLTLASIVEKEAVLPQERPVIAGVFWNRLRRDMPLQADPTVSYAVGRDGRAPTRADLQVDSPFNTYRYRGLPPGPIGNPGRGAIEAVLAPASVPYLYFVAVDDRQHHFSTTLAEHLEAVARYRQTRPRSHAS
jgi:UPF0755 protein